MSRTEYDWNVVVEDEEVSRVGGSKSHPFGGYFFCAPPNVTEVTL